MPILCEEPSLYPETLFDAPGAELSDRQWWVLYTKARQEKAVSRELLGHGIPFYLPLVKKTLASRGRRIASYAPLFAGYVFLFGSEDERIRSLKTNRVSRVLSVDDPCMLVHDLRQFQQLIAAETQIVGLHILALQNSQMTELLALVTE